MLRTFFLECPGRLSFSPGQHQKTLNLRRHTYGFLKSLVRMKSPLRATLGGGFFSVFVDMPFAYSHKGRSPTMPSLPMAMELDRRTCSTS